MRRNFPFSIILFVFLFISLLCGCSSNSNVGADSNSFVPQKTSTNDCSYGGEIKSVEAVDKYSVRFVLCEPDAAFTAKISSPIFAIQDVTVLNTFKGDSNAMSASPMGTGAYRLTEWKKGSSILLEPSSSYWGVPPISNALEFRWQQDAALRYSYTTYGSVSGIDQPPVSLVPMIKTNDNLQVLSNIPMNLYYLGFNNTISPFDQIEVRQAFAMALNREQIVLDSFPDGSELAQQMVPSNVQPGRSVELRWYETNTQEAESLLKSVNYDFNQEITLAVMDSQMQYIDSPIRVAEEVQKQLAEINVKITIKPMTAEEFTQSISDGKEMMYFYWFQADYDDGAAFFERPFIREADLLGASYTELQQQTKAVLAIKGDDARQEAFDILNQMVKDQVPLIPIGHAAHITIFRNTVTNAASNSFYENFEDMSAGESTLQFIGIQEPGSLIPADEDDSSTFRITRLLYDTLLTSGFGNNQTKPLLAESWDSNADLTEWTFQLRYNVKFSNNTSFDANDVVASFSAIWDASNPNHTGRTGEFALYQRLFGNLLNAE